MATQSVPETACQALLASAEGTLALFDFEGAEGMTEIPARFAALSATVQGAPAATVTGPDGCGSALSFGNQQRFLIVPNAPLWTLNEGSIDGWFWIPERILAPLGIVSRDQYGIEAPGHFSLWLRPERTVVARLQQGIAAPDEELMHLACSESPLRAGSWAHFGFNFSAEGAALYVNGQLAAGEGAPGIAIGDVTCGQRTESALLGDLALPWILGASVFASMNVPDERQLPYIDGAIDNFRISRVTRDFAAPFWR